MHSNSALRCDSDAPTSVDAKGQATKQSSGFDAELDCFAALAMTVGMLTRRELIGAGALGLAGLTAGCAHLPAAGPDNAFLDDVQRRTFRYFWNTTNPANGLARDRYPTPSFASMAAVGFALTAYPIGAERGFVSRTDAAARTLATLRFLWNAPQGDAARGMTGHKGLF